MTLETGAPNTAPSRPRSAAIVNLGCKVNQSEMEAAARLLREAGIPLVEPTRAADLYLVNTCTVTGRSDARCRAALRKARRDCPEATLIATGCYAQAQPDAVAAIEGVDLVLGNREKAAIFAHLDNAGSRFWQVYEWYRRTR